MEEYRANVYHWFMVASIITSVGLFPNSLVPYAKLASNWLMAMALAGIGMQVSFQQFKEAGAKPILTGLANLVYGGCL